VIGKTIGSYEILAELGRGGMGEVYRARDTRLDRDVAIKILPPAFAQDAGRLSRFAREARTLAALNHPNIAHIHELEEAGGASALVMELVEGDDLSTLIDRGPMLLTDALALARQVADALEAAHEQGIIHRDLKPANIKVRADGTVKVLDFGLAKAFGPEGGSAPADPSHSPTMTASGTELGMILGTAAYMAPEQAKGKAVDKRADIWAWGVVLYEMLTGGRLFRADTVPETLAHVITRPIDFNALPPGTPRGLRDLLARCLEKDPRQRLRDIGDARLSIDDAVAGRGAYASGPAPATAVANERPGWRVAAARVLVAAAAALAGWLARPVPASPQTRLSIALPPGEQITTPPAISPDGRVVAYAAGRTVGSSQLYLRALDTFESRAVPGSAGALQPFFSANGKTIAFFAGGKLRLASVDGGASVPVASAPAPMGGTFDADGHIVFVSGLGSGLWRVPVAGGEPEQLTKPDGAGAGYAHVYPQRLKGSRDLLFGYWGQTFYSALLSDTTRTWRQINAPALAGSGFGIYAADGQLLLTDGVGGISVVPWTPAQTSPVTGGTPVIDRVHWSVSTDRPWITVSDNGTAVFVPGNPGDRHLAWINRRGEVSQVPGDPDLISDAVLSHDGSRVVYGSLMARWIVNLTTGARTPLLSGVRGWNAAWLPGDEGIVFSSNKDGDWDLYTVGATGGEIKLLLKRPSSQHVQAVALDGTIIFVDRQTATGNDLWTLAPDGSTAPIVATRFNETSASISPDGQYVAYVSDESGRSDVFVVATSGKGPRTPVSIDGGSGPQWSRDGKELFYRGGEDLVTVNVRTTGGLFLGERRKLVDLSQFDPGSVHEFDVSPDGERFLFIRTNPASRPTRLDIIVNWADELRTKTRR
jgi:Tol biopolymer transport system component